MFYHPSRAITDTLRGIILDFHHLIHAFRIPGKYIGCEELFAGNINQTYLLHFYENKDTYYILQRLNTYVFREPEKVMDNIFRVTNHIMQKLVESGCEQPQRQVLQYLTDKDGKPFVWYNEQFWRGYRYVDNARTYDNIGDAEYFRQAGRAFGEFQGFLADFPAETLHETIPHFHDTPRRMQQLREAVQRDAVGRALSVQEEIDFILSRAADTAAIVDALNEERIPWRVTHNDTKINNVLFDNSTDQALCVIDLDTVMPGSVLYDFGDAIRSGANTAGEDEEDISLIRFDLTLFEAFTKGYLEKSGGRLTKEEIALLPASVRILTLELCARFLADYINGDVYFKVKKPGHNLIRTRNQIEMVRQIERQAAAMEGIIAKYAPNI